MILRPDTSLEPPAIGAGSATARLTRRQGARPGSQWQGILRSVRAIMAIIALTTGFALPAAPATNEVLHPAQYPAAEAVYRSFFPGAQWPEAKTNEVYCLSFGAADGAVPPDFIARFPGTQPRAITGTNELAFPLPGVMTQRNSGRKIVRLMLRTLSIHGDQARARVIYATGSESVTVTLQLAQPAGRWEVARIKEDGRVYF